ncbi:ester cyclase [Granulicella arctica]|uniref:ester cyclase n=1 Tax=Granulicella arctica TaxID=940613 RepID=UPI0037C16DFA
MISEGDTVALRGTFHGTHLGPFAGIPATGKQVSAPVMLFYNVENGRINKHWMVLDTMTLFGQLNS